MKRFNKIILLPFILSLGLGACSAPPVNIAPPVTPTLQNPTESPTSTLVPSPTITATVTASPVPTPSFVTSLPDPAGYTWVKVVDGLKRPVEVTNAADGSGRLFILEQVGVIRVLQGGVIQPEPFLDIHGKVSRQGNEQGLLGIAFHPDFKKNGFFFVDYTDRNGNTVIARYTANPAGKGDGQKADPASEKIILRIHQPYPNHNGGRLLFAPDGMLWIGMGDGGSQGDPQGNGQSLQTLLGKILRIDVDHGDPYTIPADNPYAAGGGLPEIWSYGVRNPWGLFFDAPGGDLYIADVGQDAWEEVNYVPAGGLHGPINFGWSLMEGNHSYKGNGQGLPANYQAPVFEYDHGQGCSVTGGVVSRGNDLRGFFGVYLFGDYCSGTIWGLLRGQGQGWSAQPLFNMPIKISSFGQDEQGGIYLVGLNGSIYRLQTK